MALPFFEIRMKIDLFQSCGRCQVFQICWHIECSTFTASSFRIWNSSAGIPSPPLALFVLVLPKAQMTLHYRMSDCCCLGEWSHHHDYLGLSRVKWSDLPGKIWKIFFTSLDKQDWSSGTRTLSKVDKQEDIRNNLLEIITLARISSSKWRSVSRGK